MKRSFPVLLSVAIALVGVAALLVIASRTNAGGAPDNGQQVFDSPGCIPGRYSGPGRTPHYLLSRGCPTPTAVVLSAVSHQAGDWLVTWDGSKSFDPIGGRIVSYEWNIGSGPRRRGEMINVSYRRPGVHEVVLYVTDDAGITGTARQTATLP